LEEITRAKEKKLKVLLLGPLPPPYMGPSIATEIILKSTLNDHFTILHLNTNTHKTLSTLGAWNFDRILKNLILYLKLAHSILKNWPDLVVIPISQTTSGFIKDSFYIIISRLFLRKTLLQLRGGNFKNWYDSSAVLTKIYVYNILRRTQGIIVLGEKLRHLFSGFFKEDRIFVVPNGADYKIDSQPVENGSLKLLYLGNLQPSKGVEDVLNAFVILRKNDGKFQVGIDVVGSWRDDFTKSRYQKIAQDNNLPVTFHMSVVGEKKFSILSGADVFIFPPREPEGHPWVIVEALAAGLPIISTDQGAITESVRDGINGFIVEKENPGQLADKIMLLSTDEELRFRMGKESRKIYEENFTEEKMVQRLSHCFNKVLNPYDVKTWYDGLAEQWGEKYYLYDKHFNQRFNNVNKLAHELNEQSKILDIGCASGEITVSLYDRFRCNTVGVDVSDKMIELCKKKYSKKNLHFEIGDITNLRFGDEEFDLVLSVSVIEWIKDYEAAIREVSRVLKSGGQWIVSLPNWASPFRKAEQIKKLFFKSSYLRYHLNHVSIDEFQMIAQTYGFRKNTSIFHVLPFYESNLSDGYGPLFGMMCIMSMIKS